MIVRMVFDASAYSYTMSFGYMVVMGFLYGMVYIISGIYFCKWSTTTMAQKTVTTEKEVFSFYLCRYLLRAVISWFT